MDLAFYDMYLWLILGLNTVEDEAIFLIRWERWKLTEDKVFSCSERVQNPWKQCCGSGLDPDPVGQKWPTKIEKLINYIYLSAGCSLLRAEDIFYSSDGLLGGLRIRKLQFDNFSSCFLFNFWSSKPWIRIHLKCWIQIWITTLPESMSSKPAESLRFLSLPTLTDSKIQERKFNFFSRNLFCKGKNETMGLLRQYQNE